MFDTYAEIFAERAASYHRAMREHPRARHAEFRAVLEPLGELDGVLCDLPSGGAYLFEHLPPGTRYLGVDPSDDFVAACPAGIEPIKAEVTSVPLPDASADCIVSLAALHHEPDLGAVFREMRRLLKDGGRVVVADVAADTAPATFLNGFVDANNPMGHEGHFLDEKTAAVMQGAGFVVVSDEVIDTEWSFDTFDGAGDFCRNLFWMPELDAAAVAAAMDREIGFDLVDGRPHLRWRLRRIVADAA